MTHTDAPRRMEWSGVPLILIGLFCIIVLLSGCEAQYPAQLASPRYRCSLRGTLRGGGINSFVRRQRDG